MKSDKLQELATKAQYAFDASKDFYTRIDQERNAALAYYMQLAQGNEIDGFSHYITSDVRDTVKWTLAQLMDIFYSGDMPVRFEPRNEGDVEQADIETQYIKHVIEDQNEGFLVINTWFLDALIQKNGVIKCYWDDKIDEQPENYTDKGFADYSMLLTDDEYLVKKVKVRSDLLDGEYTVNEFADLLETLPVEQTAAVIEQARFDIKGVRIKDIRQARIENVAPEDFVIDRTHTSLSLKDCPYCAERRYATRAELVADGFDFDKVMSLPIANKQTTDRKGAYIRYEKENSVLMAQMDATKAAEQVEVIYHYIMDFDGEEPQLWCILTGANGSVIFDNYEVDRPPFHVITPSINPYRFFGDSVADELIDIQYAKSNLMRAVFDNIKFSVIPRYKARGDVDLDAAIDHTAGQVVPMGADGDLEPLITPFVADSAMSFAKELEAQRAERTGFSRETAGLDPAALADSTNMMGTAILNMSQTRVKLIASTFAHTGYKTLVEHIRELLYKHEDRDKVFAVTGKYVTVSPRNWFQSRSTTVKAGLGYAGKQEQLAILQQVTALQEKIIAGFGPENPLVNSKNIYNTIDRMLNVSGIPDTSAYFTDPETYQAPPPQPSIQELQMQSYEKTEMYKADKRAEVDNRKVEIDANLQIYKTDKDFEVKNQELIYKYQRDLAEQVDNQIEKIITQREKQVEMPEKEDDADISETED